MGLVAANNNNVANNGAQGFAPGSAPVRNETNDLLRRVGIVALIAIACLMAIAASAVSLTAILTLNPLLLTVGIPLFVIPVAVLNGAPWLCDLW